MNDDGDCCLGDDGPGRMLQLEATIMVAISAIIAFKEYDAA